MTTTTGNALINAYEIALAFAVETNGQQERKKKTLLDTPDLQVFLLYVRKDGYVPPHQVTGAITVHTLIGTIRMKAEDIDYRMPAGTLLALIGNASHDVFGEEESVALVTMAKKRL